MFTYDNIKGGDTMAGIWNVNSNYNVNTKRIVSKLSFEVGQNFVARIVNLDKLTGEVLLKLLDGWQFSAKLEKGADILPEGLVKFQVEGFEEGTLQLKIANTDNKKNNTEKDSIEFLLKSKSINVDKGDYSLLNKMIKHEMPLTKENISNMKTLVDFTDRINQNPEEENAFIDKYMESKNITPDSAKGQEIKKTLKSFFSELKNLGEDDILTLVENNIDLTEKNIKSFNNIFKNGGSVYNEIKDIEQGILNANVKKESGEEQKVNNEKIYVTAEQEKETIENSGEKIIYKDINKDMVKSENENTTESITENQTETESENESTVKNGIETENKSTVKNKTENKAESKNEKLNTNENEVKESISNKEIETGDKIKEKLKNFVNDNKDNNVEKIAKAIKEQISEKTQEMKSLIKTVLEQKGDVKSEAYNNIFQVLDKNINDFKVFNSMSNSYYYLDMPLNVDNSEYKCKLMIKDERKKGKKIDSTNVKIAASVATNNMGVVDAYIKVNNFNMDIDIKCDSEWIKTLDKGKERIFKELSDIGYNLNVYVDQKKQEMNIVNCREFFEDNNLGIINTKV